MSLIVFDDSKIKKIKKRNEEGPEQQHDVVEASKKVVDVITFNTIFKRNKRYRNNVLFKRKVTLLGIGHNYFTFYIGCIFQFNHYDICYYFRSVCFRVFFFILKRLLIRI